MGNGWHDRSLTKEAMSLAGSSLVMSRRLQWMSGSAVC